MFNPSKSKIFNRALTFSVLSFILVVQSCSNKTIESNWQKEALSIDGMMDDWEPASLKYEEDLKLVYGVGNDKDKVRFVIRFNDRALAHKIDMRGMVIWLDKDKTKGVRYIDESARDRMWERMMGGRDAMRGNRSNQQPSLLSGKFFWMQAEVETEIEASNSERYKAVASFVDGNYCLEYELSRDLLNSQEKFNAGIELSGIDDELKKLIGDRRSEMKGMRESSGGPGGMAGPGGTMGGDRRGGRRGMNGRGMGGNKEMDFDDKIMWVKVLLGDQAN